ncbi:hypothetical protein ACVIGB_004920 [Bradyrhizobium sp. USDA 4341]
MIDLTKHDFTSLSVKDLLDAREAYHVHLAHLQSVYATAIGRYLIRDSDRNATERRHHSKPQALGPRTLFNSSVKDWSWPCILVFVRDWMKRSELKNHPEKQDQLVPPFLYLPDGRVVPTCVVKVDPNEDSPGVVDPPVFKSDLVGGGFPVQTMIQGKIHRGSIGCLVTNGETVFALSNRHVVGAAGREIFAGFKNTERRLGVSDALQLGKRAFSDVYPGWPGARVVANLDAGLIRVDDVKGWTAQVYGVGQVGDVVDLNVGTFRLEIINQPLIAFGATSGLMKGKIIGLFYRYKTVGGMEYVSDFVIGPRDSDTPLNNYPGDSGTIWFLDDPDAKKNAGGARILSPLALEWGGQELFGSGGKIPMQVALGICMATLCRELDVELIGDWNAGHTEYWGEWGHVKIGAYATGLIDAKLPKLSSMMDANSDNIGLDDKLLADLKPYQRGAFAPLADVADLVWRFTRHTDESNHFADMDKPGKDGKTLLDLCAESTRNVDPKVWNDYYEGIGEDRRGALPFRVWQIFDEMVEYAAANKKLEFVCAAGIVAHYIGDACQPLHISQFHHGLDLNDKAHAKVHSVYETTMIGRHGKDLIKMIPDARTSDVAEIVAGGTPTGRDAAVAVVALMQRTVKRLPPMTIVNLFNSHMGSGQVDVMWSKLKDATAACMQDGAKTLARVWEAAWRAGAGEDRGQGGKFDQGSLSKLYNDPSFLPAYPLQQLTLDADDHIVPVGGGRARRRSASTARRARPQAAKKAAKKAAKNSARKAVKKAVARKRPAAAAPVRRAAASKKTATKRGAARKRSVGKTRKAGRRR